MYKYECYSIEDDNSRKLMYDREVETLEELDSEMIDDLKTDRYHKAVYEYRVYKNTGWVRMDHTVNVPFAFSKND